MNIVVILGAIVVAFIVFTILINIIKMTVKTAFFIALAIFVMQFVLNIRVGEVFTNLLKMIFKS